MSIANYSAEFEKLYNMAKNYDIILPDGILAYKFLNNASLSSQHQQFVKVFGDLAISACPEKPHMKSEEQYLQTTHTQEEEEYGN